MFIKFCFGNSFSISTLKMSLHCFLACIGFVMKSAVQHYIQCVFFLWLFKGLFFLFGYTIQPDFFVF